MFTVTLQSMVVQEIMETFTFKVRIIENYVSQRFHVSLRPQLTNVSGSHLSSNLITTSKIDSVILHFNCSIAYYRKFELLVALI